MTEFYGNTDPANVAVRNNYPPDGKESLDAVIVTHGRIVEEALKASDFLRAEGVKVGILLLEQIKPYEQTAAQILAQLPHNACPVLFLEEEVRTGGMGMLLSDAMRDAPEMHGRTTRILALEKPLEYPSEIGQTCLEMAGLDASGIVRAVRSMVRDGDVGNV